jgi:O-antigen/teichoic acid export membrane protein
MPEDRLSNPGSQEASPAGTDATLPDSTLRRLLSRGFVRAGIVTYAFSALTLGANLVTGIVSARALGPDGRGVTAALTMVTQLAGFLFAMGVAQSLSYFIARRPQDGPCLFSTWLLMLLPPAALAIVIGELLLPTIFSSAGADAVATGRWFMFTIVLVIGLELNYGLLLGAHDFTVYNVLRFAQPTLLAGSLVALWSLHDLTVNSALLAGAVVTGLVLAAGIARAADRIGFARPDFRLGLRTVWYGVRGEGATLAANVNTRLDVAMLPAFVSAANVGLYSVATNISLIVYQMSNTFAGLVLPAAARQPQRGPLKVIGSLYATLAITAVLAVVLGVFAGPLIGVVYGNDFRDAAAPLRLLLPGAVLFAGASIVGAGVYAAARPFTATLPQLVGMVVTVVGLATFLRTGGITAAAIVSTASYGTVFVITVIAYKAVSGMPWRWFVPTPARLRALLR